MSELCYYCFQQKPELAACPHCGYVAGMLKSKYPLALPEGSILSGRYIVGRVLGQGGFGITYVAQDWQTKQLVAIKEYFPDATATHSGSCTVSTLGGDRDALFEYGKDRFADEAKAISRFINHPNIVTIYSFFEENNTAYYAMEYIRGENLLNYLNRRGKKISFGDARRILYPIMDALTAVHSVGLIHRDISPDNIFITEDNIPKLLDFGAARYSLGNKSNSLDVILKHGYAPKEQYTRHGLQGPYTDVYSLAATFYRAITGQTPQDSVERLDHDDMIPPERLCRDIPHIASVALIQGLSVYPKDRFQTMADFKAAMPPMPVIKNNNLSRKNDAINHQNNAAFVRNNVQNAGSVNPPSSFNDHLIIPKWAFGLIIGGTALMLLILIIVLIISLS